MKAVKTLLILAMTCVLFSAQGIAISEETQTTPPLRHILDIALSVAPDELVEAGWVQLNFEIRNDSVYDAENVHFAPLGSDEHVKLGHVAAGDMQAFSAEYEISPEELEDGEVSFCVAHDGIAGDSEKVEYEVSARITRVEARSDIEFTRRISSECVSSGSAVYITYSVKNTGNVPVENVRVRDLLGEFSETAEEVPAGGEVVYTNQIIAESDMISRARAEYEAPDIDGEKRKIELSEAEISVVQPELTAVLEMDAEQAEYGKTTGGTVTITAAGCDFTDVYVKDDVNGVIIADCIDISAGESVTISHTWPVRMPSDYRVMVSGMSQTGDRIEAISNGENVSLTGEFSNSELGISATAATPVINRPGKVKITVAIENTGNSAVRDVILMETTLGELRKFAIVPAGEPTYREVVVDVSEDSTFEFCVCVEDENGAAQTVEAVAVDIAISPDGEEPEKAAISGGNEIIEWIKTNIGGQDTYLRMVAVAAAVLGVLIIVLVISHGSEIARRRQRRQTRKKGESGRQNRTK